MKKRIQQMFRKLSTIARNGINGYSDYRRFVDDVINNGEIYILDTLFETKYKHKIKGLTVTKLKSKETYNIVRFNTNSQLLEDISKLFSRYNLSFVNTVVYDNNDNKIGIIIEESNKLIVSRIGDNISDTIIEITDEDSLINIYKSAINYIRVS